MTGWGSYGIVIGLQMLVLCIRNGAEPYELRWRGIGPYVARISTSKSQ